MSEQQFSELLNQLNVEDLKDVIHKLPYEKVTAVIGQSGDKNQLDVVIRMLEEKFGEQNAQQEEMMKILEQMKEDRLGLFEAPDFTIAENSNDPMLLV